MQFRIHDADGAVQSDMPSCHCIDIMVPGKQEHLSVIQRDGCTQLVRERPAGVQVLYTLPHEILADLPVQETLVKEAHGAP